MSSTTHNGSIIDPFIRPTAMNGHGHRPAAADDTPAAPLQPSKIAYRADIDGLRALAIVPVVLFHAGVELFRGGFVGVDVFFVISGFLITTGLLQDSSITRFYERRLRRILPALTTMMTISTVAALVLLLPGDLLAFGKSMGSALLFGSNVYFWRQSGYFATITETWPLLHTWSLGVEEQFYIFFPLCILVLGRWRRRVLPIAIVAMMIASFWAAQFLVGNMKGVMAFYLMPSRAWELLTGSLLATGIIPAVRNRVIGAVAALAGVAMIVYSVLAYSATTPFPGLSAIPPVLGSALIIWAGQKGEHGLSPVLGAAPLRFIGLISYSLYLWHWPIFAFVRYAYIDPITPVIATVAVAASVGAAYLSWRYVERPFRHLNSRARIWGWSAAAGAVMALASLALIVGNGFPQRFSPAIVALNADQDDSWRCGPSSFVRLGAYYACAIDLPSRDPRKADVILWGDSHAQMYVPALRAALHGRSAVLVNAYGCAPTVNGGQDANCAQIQNRNFREIVALPAKTVILAQNWPQYRKEVGKRLGRATPPDQRFLPAARRFAETVDALNAAGKTVYAVAAIPNPEYELPSVVSRDLAFHGRPRHRTGVTNAAFRQDFTNVLDTEKRLVSDGKLSLIDVRKFVCRRDVCNFIQSGHSVFADHGHVTNAFARAMGPTFDATLRLGPAKP